MTRVMLNFQHTGCAWAVHSIEADVRYADVSGVLWVGHRAYDGEYLKRKRLIRCADDTGDAETNKK